MISTCIVGKNELLIGQLISIRKAGGRFPGSQETDREAWINGGVGSEGKSRRTVPLAFLTAGEELRLYPRRRLHRYMETCDFSVLENEFGRDRLTEDGEHQIEHVVMIVN